MTLHHGLTALRVSRARRAVANRPRMFDAGLGVLKRSAILDMALGAGHQAPDFELPGADGAPLRLGALLARGAVVVTFYRGGWCPYCSLQLRAYQSMLPELAALGVGWWRRRPKRPNAAATWRPGTPSGSTC